MDKVLRIHFEDHGQDFLWWDLDDSGKVVDCGPFQASVWVGSVVICEEGDPVVGEKVVFTSKSGDVMQLRYSIEKVEEKEVTHVG